MATNGGRIDYTIGFNVDKSSLNGIQTTLTQLSNIKTTDFMNMNPNIKSLTQANAELKVIKDTVNQVRTAYDKAFDPTIGITNINKLSANLKNIGIQNIQQSFAKLGPTGVQTFHNIANQISKVNLQLRQTNNFATKLGQSLVNTITWGIGSGIFNRFTGSIQQALGYVQHLDTSLNDIRIVTNKSADEMDRFAEKANKAAQSLGKSTTEYTEAALIYYQQGLSDEEVAARTETTLKASNVTGQSAKAVSEQLTAVWNGYRVTAEGTEEAVDKLAAVAATTAADLEELSTGMSKVASAANSMGVDMDQLNATIATIESVTRQAPESVGTALKTIYARMGDLKLGDTDEDGLKLGDVSSTLSKVGIEILDVNGELRDMGAVIEEIGEKWETWTKAQQTAIAESVAGKRQYNNLFALFDNWDMYTEALETSRNSMGTLQKQQDIYMDSISGHLQQLKTEWEDLFDSIIDENDIKNILDNITKIVNVFSNIIDSIGGGTTVLLGIITLLTQIQGINDVISTQIGDMIGKSKNVANNEKEWAAYSETATYGIEQDSAAYKEIESILSKITKYGSLITDQEKLQAKELIEQIKQEEQRKEVLEASLKNYREIAKASAEALINDKQDTHGKALEDDYKNVLTNSFIYDEATKQAPEIGAQSVENLTLVFDHQKEAIEELKPALEEYVERARTLQDIKETYINEYGDKDISLLSQEEQERAKGYLELIEQLKNELQEFKTKNISPKLELISPAAEGQVKQVEKELSTIEEKIDDLSIGSNVLENHFTLLGKKGTEAFQQINNTQQQVIQGLTQLPSQVEQSQGKLELFFTNVKTYIDNIDYKKLGQGITDLVSGLTGVAFGIQSIKNLGSIWENKDLSMSDKMLKTITALGFALPGAIKGIKKLKSGIDSLGLSLKINLMPYMIALVAAITAISFIFQKYQSRLDNVAKSSQEAAKKQQELIDSAKEEKQAVDELSTAYNRLYEDIKDQNDITQDQKDEIYNLVKAYGDNDLIVQALAGDYDKLKESINGVREAENQQLQDELEKGIKSNKNALKDSIIANAKISQRDGDYYDFGLFNGTFWGGEKEANAFKKELAKITGISEDAIDTSNHITYENLIKILTSDSEELHNLLDSYSDLNISQDIRKLLDENDDLIKTIQSDVNDFQSTQLEQIGFNNKDLIENILNLQDFENTLNSLAEQAYKEGAVESLDAGKEWAKKFLEGYSDEINNLSDKETVKNALLENLLPTEEDLKEASNKKAVTFALKEFQKGGNVDLLNRPKVQNDDGTYSTVETQTFSDKTETRAINFTPILVDEKGNYIRTLSDDELQNYAEEVIAGVHDDYLNLQIGAEFKGEHAIQAASLAAEEIHNLQEKYYDTSVQDISELEVKLTEALDNYDNAQLSFIAKNTSLFEAMIEQGMSVDEILDNLSVSLDAATHEDHIIKIDTLINGKPGQKGYEQAKAELFSSENFDLGISEEDFEDLSEGDKFAVLALQRNEELQTIKELSKEEEEVLSERNKILEEVIEKEKENNEELKKLLDEQQTNLEDKIKGKTALEIIQDKDIKAAKQNLDKLTNSYNQSTQKLQRYGEAQKQLTKDTINYKKQLNITYQAINALNKDIDSLQSSYQSLQNIVEDYNEDGKLTLDNLQSLIAMDSAYAASLDIQNDKMSINEEYSKAMVEAKLQLARAEVTAAYMAELEAIANGEVVDSSTGFINAEYASQEAIQGTIAAAREGYEALMQYAAAKDAAKVNKAATEQATKAYLNKMQMIDNLAAQPTSEILSKADKSSKSGSGGSSKKPEQKEHEERDTDIYRTINKELEQIESTLGRIQKINDHEWGIDAQKTLEEENKLLDEQLDKLKEKQGMQERDLSIRRKQLEDIGVSFTADGSAMINAEDKLNQLYAQYNSMIDHYNTLSVEGQEAYKTELEAEKKKIDDVEKQMNEYESGFSDYQSTLDKILDTHYEAIANEVNQFNNMVEVHLELNEAEKEWNDFWKEVVEDVEDTDFAGQIAASIRQLKVLIGTRNDNNASTVKILTNHLNETIGEVQAQIASANRGGEDSIFGDDTALSKEKLTKYRDDLMGAVREAKTEIDNISDNYIKLLESAQTKIDEQIEGWNSIGDQINHDIELIKLVSGDKAFDALNKQYEKQYENDLKLIETQKMSQDYWKEQIAKYQKLVETTDKSSVEWKTYDKSLQDSIKNYRKAVQDLDKTVQESIKDLQTWRENNVKAIEDTLDKAMSGGIGLDLAEKQWKLINDYADQYYDNVERAFNMEDYTNVLNDAANAIGLSAENQDRLNQFREQELAQLNAKNKLTQYDIDESKARLEILKAEIALQDAQKNKSNMRLRRDSQGNYVYQYIGDEAEQEKAENGLLTARREWYELVKQRNKETNEYIIQLGKERIDLQNQLAQAQLDGDQERINILLDLIKKNEEQQVLAYDWAEDAKKDLMDGTAKYFANVENNNILPMWDTTVNKMVDKWANDDDSFIKASATAIKKLQEVQDKYVERTKEVLDKAGIEYTELKEQGIDPTRESLEGLVETNEELGYELENVNNLLQDQEGYLRDAEAAYNNLKDAAVRAIEEANYALQVLSQTAIQTIQNVQAAIAAANSASNAMASMANNYANSNPGTSGRNSNNSYTPKTNKQNAYVTRNGVGGYKLVNSSTGQAMEYWSGQSKTSGLPDNEEALEYFKKKYKNLSISYLSYTSGFATGGYTGAWGKDGKLAVLHEKELVLNKDDTTNILKAVEAIRQVVSSSNLGGNLLNASMISSNMLSRISAGVLQGVSSFDNSSSNTATSMVINADFSGVRSADEIYQALLELQNYGLQQNYSVAPHINIGY